MKIVQTEIANFASSVTDLVAEKITEFQSQNLQTQFRFGLTGGSSVGEIYEKLSQLDGIDWSKILLILTDERFLPSTSPLSNFALIAKYLPKENLIGFTTDNIMREVSGELMSGKIQKLLNERTPLFDLLLLGVGEDGHIASLFPHVKKMPADSWAVMTETDAFDVRERLSLAYKTLANAKNVIFLLKGENKKAIFAKMQESGDLPVQKLIALLKQANADVTIAYGN